MLESCRRSSDVNFHFWLWAASSTNVRCRALRAAWTISVSSKSLMLRRIGTWKLMGARSIRNVIRTCASCLPRASTSMRATAILNLLIPSLGCSRRPMSIQNVVTQRRPSPPQGIHAGRKPDACVSMMLMRVGLVPNPIFAGHPYDCEGSELSERRRLLQITDGTGAAEELPLEIRGNGIPAHKHGRAQTLQNLLFFVGKGSTVVVIPFPLNRLIDMDCQPFFVFGKRRVDLLKMAEFPRFVRRTRCVGEERPEFGCFGSVLLCSEHLIRPF
jgi:hypothetical protein